MRRYRIVILLGLIAFLACIPYAHAATVRGKLNRVTKSGVYPALGVSVTVSSPSTGRSYPAYTDKSGFFYLYNIPPGTYTLEVGVTKPPRLWTIHVPSVSQFDLDPIVVP